MAKQRGKLSAWSDLLVMLEEYGVCYTVHIDGEQQVRPVDNRADINYGKAVKEAVEHLQASGRLTVDQIDDITHLISMCVKATTVAH